MCEVSELENAVYHRKSNGNKGIDRPDGQTVKQLLPKHHSLHFSPNRVSDSSIK